MSLPLRGSSRKVTELATSSEGHAEEFFQIADAIIKPGMHLSSAERLELYHRQYWFRILDSLAGDFPLPLQICGEPLFWDFFEVHLLCRPSRSFTLRHLGEGIAEFLDSTSLLNEQQQLWFGSSARMGCACMESFEALQSAVPDPDDLQDGVIELQEHVRLLDLPMPADS
ncbi:MAG: putative DNA-binding domain-containing protein [Verrucomicrobia bacterium]|nr:putative DNA-binding domain-containing protein [Verrucomicrobiota bacterium]